MTRRRSRWKNSVSNLLKSNLGFPSFAVPGPVRAQGCGVMQRWKPPPAACDLNCSQRHSRMKLCPRSIRKRRYSSKSILSGVPPHSGPGPIPSCKLFQM